MQKLSILCNAGAIKRHLLALKHPAANTVASVKPHIQNYCMFGTSSWVEEGVFSTYETLKIKRNIKFRAASVNSVPDIDLTPLELYCTNKLLPCGCQCQLKQTRWTPCKQEQTSYKCFCQKCYSVRHLQSPCMLMWHCWHKLCSKHIINLSFSFSFTAQFTQKHIFKWHQLHDYSIMLWFTRNHTYCDVRIKSWKEIKIMNYHAAISFHPRESSYTKSTVIKSPELSYIITTFQI